MIHNYGMFSVEGNNAVHLIVENALENNLRWIDVYRELQDLSFTEGFEEAMDTEVREIVYEMLESTDNFYDSNDSDGQPDEAQEWHDYDPDC
jgi:hypothetical protein